MLRADFGTAPASRAGDGSTVLERVLLAIIDAHADSGRCRQERLDIAMTALLGPAQSDSCMERAVLFMLRQRRRELCDVEMLAFGPAADCSPPTTRSIQALARFAAREILGCETVEDILSKSGPLEASFRGRVRSDATEYDPARDAAETEAVQRLCRELAEWDVPTQL